ncbi:MAG TPA: hypothetical protein VN476_05105 [Pyrinomonadaceae bacterium]|nr:hypothetical protein [Pyrinomonadaceae bacterium]
MKRTTLILLMTLTCAWPLLAQGKDDPKQTKCTLPIERAPELRGLRLGAPQAGVLSRFPGTSVPKPDQFGITQLRFTVVDTAAISKGLPGREKAVQPDMAGPGDESAFIVDSAKFSALKGVRRVRLRFTDGRLSFIQIAYDDSIKWDSADEFVETVAKNLSLSGTWNLPEETDGSGRERELRCEGFAMIGSVGGDPSDTRIAAQLSIEDLAASKIIAKREEDLKEKAKRDEEAKRKNFKP